MGTVEELLEDLFAGQERLSRDEIHRRAVVADLDPSQAVGCPRELRILI